KRPLPTSISEPITLGRVIIIRRTHYQARSSSEPFRYQFFLLFFWGKIKEKSFNHRKSGKEQ
ncbi:hypothetical protein Tsubulata_034349, partial [Turnera subulata]